jgi:hypothetical protein
LEEHRAREALFVAAVARDPLLARMPFLYLFGARTAVAER